MPEAQPELFHTSFSIVVKAASKLVSVTEESILPNQGQAEGSQTTTPRG